MLATDSEIPNTSAADTLHSHDRANPMPISARQEIAHEGRKTQTRSDESKDERQAEGRRDGTDEWDVVFHGCNESTTRAVSQVVAPWRWRCLIRRVFAPMLAGSGHHFHAIPTEEMP